MITDFHLSLMLLTILST